MPDQPMTVERALADVCRHFCGSWADQNRHDDACTALRTAAPTMRYGVPDDPEATEHLRTQLIAITEAERRALNDAACFIAASSQLPGVQGLAGAVLNVANRGCHVAESLGGTRNVPTE